jgi:AraC-like DNA-binding protein
MVILMNKMGPMVVYANHANFTGAQEQWNSLVMSRLCLWSKGGQGQIVVNGEKFSLRTGDYLFLPWAFSIRYLPDINSPFFLAGIHLIPHMDYSTDPSKYQFKVAHDPKDLLAKVRSRNDTPLTNLHGLIRYHLQADAPLMLISEAIVAHFQGSSRDADQLKALAGVLIHELQRAQNLQGIPLKLRELLIYIDDNLHKSISASDLADHLELSDSQLRRLFRRWLQLSPFDYIAHKRIEKASSLLTSSRLSIDKIARLVGYEDPFYFSRVFKKIQGISPSGHRKNTGFI